MCPAIFSTHKIPSWLALWASHGPSVTSPIANIPFSSVSSHSFVMMWPLSILILNFSKPRFSVFAIIPIAKINFSEVIVLILPSHIISAETFLSNVSTDLRVVFVLIFIPLLTKLVSTIFYISSSSLGRIDGSASTTVTITPKSL